MERMDFHTVIKKIIDHCREGVYTDKNKDKKYTQTDLVTDIFSEHYTSNENMNYDSSSVSRWINGKKPVSPEIINYYRENDSVGISDSFKKNCLKNIYDLDGLYEELLSLVRNDPTLSEKKKNELLDFYGEKANESEICDFIGLLIFDAIDRHFVPAEKYMLPTSAITVSACVFGADVPAPCRFFCGRDNEIGKLHADIMKYQKVFVTGFAGIGKSEFAKAYAQKFKKEYKNILYFNYPGSLKEMVTSIDYAGDNSVDDEQTKFTKHIRLLKSLRSDSLIIIDNFNSTNDSLLSTLINYSCKMIFTTRSNLEYGHIFNLDVIESTDELFNFVGKYFSYANENKNTVTELIKAVHHHTLSVEMIAKLLEKGLHSPEDVLEHLRQNSADPVSSDKIKVKKDGENRKETYYNHIRSLFSLYLLDKNYQTIMRNMVLFDEVRIIYFAKQLELADTNGINDLCDLGFIENNCADLISLHPMIRDIVALDLKPSFENCGTIMKNIKGKIMIIGNELPDSKNIISCIKSTIKYLAKSDKTEYLNFLESAFTFLDNYKEYDLMEMILSETEKLLKDKSFGTDNNRALLLNNRAMMLRNKGEKIPHAISLMNTAISMCDSNSNPVLFANLHMNLGLLYIENNETKCGLEFMDKAYLFIKLSGQYVADDFITMARNYAVKLSENAQINKALEVLCECEFATEGCRSINHARLIYDLGTALITTQNYSRAIKKFNSAFDELSELGCFEEITARKIAAAELLKKSGFEYPAEWEVNYLEL